MLEKSPRLKRIQWVALTFLTLAGIVNYLDRSTLSSSPIEDAAQQAEPVPAV